MNGLSLLCIQVSVYIDSLSIIIAYAFTTRFVFNARDWTHAEILSCKRYSIIFIDRPNRHIFLSFAHDFKLIQSIRRACLHLRTYDHFFFAADSHNSRQLFQRWFVCPAMPSIFHSDAGCGCHMCRHVAPRRWILRRNWNFFPSTRIQSNARVLLDFSFATIAQFCARPCINRRTACNTVCRADIDDIFEIHEMLLRLAPPRFILFNFFFY